jgi:predicted CXXCH cytochrome family protein
MLPAPQAEVCLSCHGSQSQANERIREGILAADAEPQLFSRVLSQPFQHPLTAGSYSRREEQAVTCTSCHSPHRGATGRPITTQVASGRGKLSPRDPTTLEVSLCQTCHGAEGERTQSLLDISRFTNPRSTSFHPLESPSKEDSPSVVPQLAGREISCTDCHANSDSNGPAGPHASGVSYILRAAYETVDGSAEAEETYALCYGCHDRTAVLDTSPFPLHRLHVVEQNASCSTCHSPHGSVDNRALVRFGEETAVGGVSESLIAGRIGFESFGPGEGSCYLTCHGVDHGPLTYDGALPGAGAANATSGSVFGTPGANSPRQVAPPRQRPRFRPRPDRPPA